MTTTRRFFILGAVAGFGGGASRPLTAAVAGWPRALGVKGGDDFAWNNGDLSAHVAIDPHGAVTVAPQSDPSGRSGAWVRQGDGPIRPEWFGAKGDGVTNDTRALAALAYYVNKRGGGEVAFRRATYVVGVQHLTGKRGAHYAYRPEPVMEFVRCTRPVIVRGNGARLRCAAGLRYGTFDPVTGTPTKHKLKFTDSDEMAAPYDYMVRFDHCSGAVELSDIELDGNLQGLVIGGPFGDQGRQIMCVGVGLYNCTGPETLRDVHTHHHALDGIKVHGINAVQPEQRTVPRVVERVRADYNARQGCSFDGGWGYRFVDCQFNHTGKAGLASNPRGGIDLEAHSGKRLRALSFDRCEFINNGGPGVVADEGDDDGAVFTDCLFVGTTNWAAWPKKPGMVFRNCRFVGAIVHCFGSAEKPNKAAQFFGCSFTDDPARSPSGQVYLGKTSHKPIIELGSAQNVLFSDCTFQLRRDAILPSSQGAIYKDCTMTQTSPREATPRGTYRGRTSIRGNVDVAGSTITGTLLVNGRQVTTQPRASKG